MSAAPEEREASDEAAGAAPGRGSDPQPGATSQRLVNHDFIIICQLSYPAINRFLISIHLFVVRNQTFVYCYTLAGYSH